MELLENMTTIWKKINMMDHQKVTYKFINGIVIYLQVIENCFWLVVSIPLKNMSSSIGMMKFPTEWEVIKVMFQLPPTRW